MTTRESTDASAAVPTPAPRRAPSGAVADVVLTVLLLALFGWGFLEAAQWSFQAALFPRIVTGSAFVLAALHLVHALLRLRRRAALTSDGSADTLAAEAEAEADADADDAVQLFRTAGPQRWAAALGWVVGFFVLLFVGGLFVTAPVFSLLYLRFAGGRTWVFSAVYAVVTGVVLYLAFEVALGVPTPPGLFLN
ncbi:tripartite tricarboxylate transporter TctB family protein [Pseudonocardia hierapolitana]|uniref:Tripartite tricarboxylate transporter TctB family protein n=1 Tax=Pseudonocardia hierapolitana TaxID=1128676 RepID=A0A561T4V7_9PSEU|nr:tripartite tricarboxylate transporter TctB family protein [Pseudonocardia hierapolitana]TWF82129.1 tripartite tricarboxylate transporter TctB family protein [Pseudonocardia hierapolitana]